MNSVIATGGGVHKLSCLLKNDLYKCALLGSFVLSLISFLGIPAVLRYGELHRDIWRALLAAGFVLTAVIAILFLAALGYFAERQVRAGKIRQRSFSLHLKRAGVYGCVFAAAALAYFLLCGMISSALYFFLGNLLFYSTIKLNHRYYHDSAQRSCPAGICAAASGFFPFRLAIYKDDPGRAGSY